MKTPLHEQLANLLMALQSATARNDAACLTLVTEKARQLLEEVKQVEQQAAELKVQLNNHKLMFAESKQEPQPTPDQQP